MKKSVILLITLFFITALSLLILKNLNDTDSFVEKQNYSLNNTQVLIAVKNTKNEVSKLLKQNREFIDDALDNEIFQTSIPIKDLTVLFSIKKYDKTNINEIKVKGSKKVEDKLLEYDIFEYDIFKEIYNDKLEIEGAKVDTRKQLDDIISTFIIQTYSEKILNVKDELGFLDAKDLYELNIKVDFNNAIAKAYYILKNDGKVQYFDISFK
jgi:hypothetical protein